MESILEVRHLTFGYDDETYALENLNMSFESGKTTAILGANGAGKSTLFLHLNGILQPEKGEVLLHGEKIRYDKISLRKLREKVGIVFQNPDDQLFSASVYQDISFGAVNMGLSFEKVHRRVSDVMEQMAITALQDKPTHSLSFGQKKRVSIAGILVMQPEIIILDEPTAGLDPAGISELMRLLKQVCQQWHTTIILSTHDIDMVPLCADYIYVMDHGKIAAEGTPKEIFAQPAMLRERHLRLPWISRLLEVLKNDDGFEVDFSEATIPGARRELLQCLKAQKNGK